jgi:hypothetical protein
MWLMVGHGIRLPTNSNHYVLVLFNFNLPLHNDYGLRGLGLKEVGVIVGYIQK